MTEATNRVLILERDGTATVPLSPDELALYDGPTRSRCALFRVQTVSATDLEAELAGIADVLPWLRDVDRERAVRDLHASGAPRTLLDHVARTPVAAFGPTKWIAVEVVRGRWESGEPFRSDRLCAGGGMVFDAALPIGMGPDDVKATAAAVPRGDPRRRERLAVLLGQHDDGLSAD